VLGERESGTERLREAVKTYREALKEYTRERAPLHWAMAQNNLGNALTALGKRGSGTETLEEAVFASCEALKEYTRERTPHQWAIARNNLGNALAALGKRESGTETLKKAVKTYRENGPRLEHPETIVTSGKVGRNKPCPCGSGKKYKYCHGSHR
jgi:tetratricopeptide (TPR) repeat protein